MKIDIVEQHEGIGLQIGFQLVILRIDEIRSVDRVDEGDVYRCFGRVGGGAFSNMPRVREKRSEIARRLLSAMSAQMRSGS